MPPSSHKIRWKGREEGPFTREQIRGKLASGELSLLHRVEVDGKWIGLGDFLGESAAPASPSPRPTEENPVPAREAARPAERAMHAPVTPVAGIIRPKDALAAAERRARLAYLFCGLCFVLPVLATIPAVVLGLRTLRAGDRHGARLQFALATLMTLLGLAFWAAVRSAYSRGMI